MREAQRHALLLATAVFAALVVSFACPRTALCDDEAEGRRRFKNGTELYRKNRFLEAAEEFEAGYRAAPRPLFLLNIGHSYRRGGELKRAREAYKKLLDVEPNLPQRAEVEGYLRTIDDALAVSEIPLAPPPRNGAHAPQPQAASPPRVPELQPQPSSGTDETPMPVFVERPSDASSSDEDEASRSVASRPWFWVAVAGVLIAGGVAAAMLLKSDDRCPADACFRER